MQQLPHVPPSQHSLDQPTEQTSYAGQVAPDYALRLHEEEVKKGYQWALITAVAYIIPGATIFAPIVNAIFLVIALTSRMPDGRRYPGTGWLIGLMVVGALLYLMICAYVLFVVVAISLSPES